ncbi:MAG: SBBP repeat-containing protein, partial [Candidatus Helarchaeota archaeon]
MTIKQIFEITRNLTFLSQENYKKQKKKCLIGLVIFSLILLNAIFFSIYIGAQQRFLYIKPNPRITTKISNDDELYIIWNVTWGGTGSEEGWDVAFDSDGYIYAVGKTSSFGAKGSDMVFLKYYPNGTLIWNKTWGGALDDCAHKIAINSSGDIYITGYTCSYGAGGRDIFLIKYFPNGTLAWNITWGKTFSEAGRGIALSEDGFIYISGYTNSSGAGDFDFLLIKFYSNGTEIWNTTWGGLLEDLGIDLALDSNKNIYVSGYSYSYGPGTNDFALVKFLPNGTRVWNRTWGDTGSDSSWGITTDKNDNIYIFGHFTNVGTNDWDFGIVKYSPNGTEVFNITWGGPNYEVACSGLVDDSGNIYVVGMSNSYGNGNYDFLLGKFYSNTTRAWNITWGGVNEDKAFDLTMDDKGNFIIVGKAESYSAGLTDIALVRFCEDFIRPWSSNPVDSEYQLNSLSNITWILYDNVAGGFYSVLLNGTQYLDWSSWTNETPIIVNINTSILGVWNYTIIYNDSTGLSGTPNTVFITITMPTQTTQTSTSISAFEL